mmetsp:Transcript_112988/g.326459  ORF Transcript_112988/g.326459 Transcript_112988/m.326459 type:complete len:370 (+) Transcript_112988:72-1181(+)
MTPAASSLAQPWLARWSRREDPGESTIAALQGYWWSCEYPEEQYFVEGWRVTRISRYGTCRFSLAWSRMRRQLRWGSQYLIWVDINRVAWVLGAVAARPPWRWCRATPWASSWAPSPRLVPPPRRSRALTPSRSRRQTSPTTPRRRASAPARRAILVPFSASPDVGVDSRSPSPRHVPPPRPGHGGMAHGGSRWAMGAEGGGYSAARRRYGMRRSPRQSQPYEEVSPCLRAAHASGGALLPCGLTMPEVSALMHRDITPEDYELLLRLDEAVPKRRPSPGAVRELLRPSPGVPSSDDEGVCSICLEGLGSPDAPWETPSASDGNSGGDDIDGRLALLPCGHRFHRNCIAKWLTDGRGACPVCGAVFQRP